MKPDVNTYSYRLRIGDSLLCACGRMLEVGDTAILTVEEVEDPEYRVTGVQCEKCEKGEA